MAVIRMTEILYRQLTGQTEAHLVQDASGQLLHPQVLTALNLLKQEAAREGFELTVASAFRGYERQLKIWASKVQGLRPVLSVTGDPLDVDSLSREALMWAILRWSALPGASRHHWGTDIDVYDAAAMDSDYQLQLTPNECEGEGVFAAFHCWLDERIAANRSFGFYRPYALDRNGVSPEPWHISYAPLSLDFQTCFSVDVFERLLDESDIPLVQTVQHYRKEVYQRFINNCCLPPWEVS